MSFSQYINNHPISYWSVIAPFSLVSIVSTFLWGVVILDIQAEYFGTMLTEQRMFKWFWFFASVSLLFLSINISRHGSIENYEHRCVKIFGSYFGNSAIVAASSYIGILWGALLPVAMFNQDLPYNMEFSDLLSVCVAGLISVTALYTFYLILYTNSRTPIIFKIDFRRKPIRVLVGIWSLAFFIGRSLDILKIFKPDLF